MGPKWRAGSRFGAWVGSSLVSGSSLLGVGALGIQGKLRLDRVRVGRYHFGRECWRGTLLEWPAGATEGVDEGLGRRIAEELGSFWSWFPFAPRLALPCVHRKVVASPLSL